MKFRTAGGGKGILHVGVALGAMLVSGTAIAQDANDEDVVSDEIVVTGTLIRGIAPGGTQSIGVGQEEIAAIGATNTSDLVSAVPQAGNFLSFVGVRGSNNFSLAVNRPSLRYLGNAAASGATTLLLLDGHRLPGMGILQSSPDLDAIAVGAIERLEVITDGGSATYGSDAIGGVMNFITRKSFKGVEAQAKVGFADNYMEYNAGITVGGIWDAFSAYVSYDYSHLDPVFGRDRDYSRRLDYINGAIPADLDCAPGSISAGGVTYGLPGYSAGLGNRCDNSEDTTIYAQMDKHSVFARIGFDPGHGASFDMTAYYVSRKNVADAGSLFIAGGLAIDNTNPFAATRLAMLPGSPASGKYFFNFSPLLGNSTPQLTDMESYGITPTVKIDLGRWQANVLLNYGVGKSNFIGQLLNAAPIAAATAAGTFDPFNLGAPGNASTMAAALDFFQYGRAKHQLMNARLVLDGPLVDLPAGPVSVAVGAEYYWERYNGYSSRSLTAAAIEAASDRVADRNVKSIFGEVSVPVFGDGNGPFHSLTLSAAARYDDYSDFGSTFNPKFGADFKPVEGLTVRGSWGQSFQAPGISDIALSGAPNFNILPISVRPFVDPTLPVPASRPLLVTVAGTISPLSPQEATTWNIGFDVKPLALPGFAAGLTYYNIDYRGVIGFPPIFLPPVFYRDFGSNYVTYDEGDAAMRAYFDSIAAEGATNTAATLGTLGNSFANVYGVLDARTQNLARIKTDGIDFYLRYRHETAFGALYLDTSGTRILNFRQQSNPAAAIVDTLSFDTTKLRMRTAIGADVGNLRAQLTWNWAQGYDVVPTASNGQQSHIDDFHVFDLFVRYDVPSESRFFENLSFTLNVDNLFDQAPPEFNGLRDAQFGYSGFTLGRVVKLGVRARF